MKRLVVIGCLVAGANASADDANPEAAALFEEAHRLKKAGQLDEACAAFEKSYRLERAAGTALNLAECEERAGNWEYALELYVGAAKVFERSDRVESARFAHERAEALRRAHPPAPKAEPLEAPPPAPPPARESNKVALGIGIGGVAIGAVGAVLWTMGVREIQDWRDTKLVGPVFDPSGAELRQVDQEDCGRALFVDPQEQARFDDVCATHRRLRWVMPVTFLSAAVGVGALLYWRFSRPEPRRVAVVPAATPQSASVRLMIEW